MLPTQENIAIQTDILPTQNIGHLDQNQPQVYSLLSDSKSPSSIKKPRRKKTTKLEETIPVMLNPQITRTPTGITFGAPYHHHHHHHSMTLPESIPSFVSAPLINGHTLPFRLLIEHDSYDANNNINHNEISSLSMSLNSSVSVQTQQSPPWSNDSVRVINSNSMSQMIAESQLVGLNRILNNKIDERTVSMCSTQQNEYKYLSPSFTYSRQESPISHFHPIPSSLSSTHVSAVAPTKPKNKHPKRLDSRSPIEQLHSTQQISQCPTTFTQSTVSNGLPSIIPTSVTVTPINSDEPPLSMDISMTTNFIPLTPPASISSIKSPPTNIKNEYSLIPIQKNLLSQTTNNTTDVNSISRQYFHDQRYSQMQNTINNSNTNNLPYNLQRLLVAANQQYCMVHSDLIPTNILPLTCASILPGTIATTPSILMASDIKKKRKRCVRKPKVMQSPIGEISTHEQSLTSKSLTAAVSTTKERKHKKSSKKDIRPKKQLQRLTRRNRLAVLKFMMQKRKQQKQERISIQKLPDIKTQQVVPKLISTQTVNSDKIEPHLPDIIAPNLIYFDDEYRFCWINN
ncbi:unnamed protein product [Rotaria sordida]|uniref:Uncharacterized protein n=1 Tax=Rotaria sordida TaxID=392033 RepID=A0A819LGH3_9BILA|nr:unnamed protein product [Rotaria sordida]